MTSATISFGRMFLRRTILQTSARRTFKSSTAALTNAATESQSKQTIAGGEPEHIKAIVDQISQLKFYEVTILSEALKRELKIPDVQRVVATGSAAATAGEEAEGTAAAVKSAYTVKLTKFDDSKKVALIKEIKKLVEGINLVEAKRFVEECPKVIRANIPKDEAEALQKQLEAAGGVVKVE